MHEIIGNPDVHPLYLKPESRRVKQFREKIWKSSPWLNGTMERYLSEKRAIMNVPNPRPKKRVTSERRLIQIRIGRLQNMTFRF
jgi:hypothetical protein